MKNLIIAAAVFAAAVPAVAQNININIGQPGYYGNITIGDYPPPQVVYAQPIIVERQSRYAGQPMYLRVPPGHMKHWEKHCRQYNACGRQVFFVRDDWYTNTYAPRYMSQHQPRYVQQQPRYAEQRRDYDERDGDHGHGHGKGHDKHDKHGDDDNGHDNGHGHGRGHGN